MAKLVRRQQELPDKSNNRNVQISGNKQGIQKTGSIVRQNESSPDVQTQSSSPNLMMRLRMFVGIFLLVALAAGYLGYVTYGISVTKSEYYRSKANSQQLSSYRITANRGTIYDRNKKILAQSTTVWDVVISPKAIAEDVLLKKEIEKKEKGLSEEDDYDEYVDKLTPLICTYLSRTLDVDYERLKKACGNFENEYYVVKGKVDKATKDTVSDFIIENNLGVFDITLRENSKRYYPNDGLASNIIGFTNSDNEGVYGLEAYYDDYLQGIDGLIVTAKDARGNAMPYDYEDRYEASDGNSIVLTLDENVQYYLQKNLENAVKEHKAANRGTGIIMNAKTGAIVAMATAPSYDLNNPSKLSENDELKLEELRQQLTLDYAAGTMTDQKEIDEKIEEDIDQERAAMREKQWKNKAVSELYYPGSVFKVITCASALEEEVISENSSFTCNWIYTVEDTDFHCWTTMGHGTVNLQQAITASCNPSFIQIGLKLGQRLFCDYFKAFGFTEKTGIDLPGEVNSLYVPYERMGKVELSSSAFGQTNKITPIQMICAFAAAINGGYLVTPHVVDRIIDKNGNVIKTAETTIKRQVISGETSERMRRITEHIVSDNGGVNAYIAGYRIGGKSGTSQKLDEYKSYEMRYVGSFCAFTPADDPEYIMLVCIDEPMGGKYYGSNVAAPVVSAVFSECLEYLGVYPQYTADELALQNTTVPNVNGITVLEAGTKLKPIGLNYVTVGDEDSVIAYTVPGASESIPKRGTVMLYMQGAEEQLITVPDLLGHTVAQVNTILTGKEFNVSLSGTTGNESATAVSQSIEAGTQVPKGTVISVTFLVNDSDAG